MPTLRKPSVGRRPNAFSLLPALVTLLVAVGPVLLCAPPAAAQAPGAGQPLNRHTELFLRANRVYEYGRDAKDYGESQHALRTAIPMLQDFLRAAPDHELAQKAHYRLGMAYLLTGDLVRADEIFQFVIRKYRTGHYVATAAYRLAAQRYNEQDWLGAAPWFQMAAREAEKADLRHKALYYDARCLILGREADKAIVRLKEIITDQGNPYRDYARLAVGQLLASQGKHEEALLQFEALLNPTTAPQERAQAMLSAGESAAKLGQVERAEGYLRQVLDTVGLDPTFKARAQVGLMEARFQEGDHAAVLELMERGDFKGDEQVQAQVFMIAGRSLSKMGRHEEAARSFFNVEHLAPLTALGFEASYRRLMAFYQVDNPNLAAQCDGFERIYGEPFKDHEWLHQARLLKAESLFLQNRITSAAEAYSQVDPDKIPGDRRAALLFRRGWCLAESGDYHGASQSLSRFIDTYPEHPEFLQALAQRGKAFLELDQLPAAERDLKKVLDSDPPVELGAFARQHSAKIYQKQREYRKMIADYEALLNDYGTLPDDTIAHAHYWIGWGWFKLEDWDRAVEHLERARTLVPEFYEEPATTHLILANYSSQNPTRLKEEVIRFRTNHPDKQLPSKMLTWLGIELFRTNDFSAADDFLTLVSDPEDPSRTDLIVWRRLAKARLKLKHYDRALSAVEEVIAREEKDVWRADAFLDKAHILIGLEKWEDARTSAHLGLKLNPRGPVKAGLLMTLGTLAEQRADFDSASANFLEAADLFVDDTEIKAEALHRAAEALTKAGRADEAAQAKARLRREFPNWKPDEAE